MAIERNALDMVFRVIGPFELKAGEQIATTLDLAGRLARARGGKLRELTKIGPVFTPIFEHHQKLIFDAKRVGLSSGSPLLAFGGKSNAVIASNVLLWTPVSRRNASPFSSLSESNLIVASIWRQRIIMSLKEGYARGLLHAKARQLARYGGIISNNRGQDERSRYV